jgi:hypothetical protein
LFLDVVADEQPVSLEIGGEIVSCNLTPQEAVGILSSPVAYVLWGVAIELRMFHMGFAV